MLGVEGAAGGVMSMTIPSAADGGEETLLALSVCDTPESDASIRSGLLGVAGGKVNSALAMTPASSVRRTSMMRVPGLKTPCCTVMLNLPVLSVQLFGLSLPVPLSVPFQPAL